MTAPASAAERERPIIFSVPMVRQILVGMKTQTRRVVKPQPAGEWATPGKHSGRYGRPGTMLWVRETWVNVALRGYPPVYFYRADDEWLPPRDDRSAGLFWRPSIHMPRAASRITLRVTDVRVQRLQDISDADAIAEGCPAVPLHALDCDSMPPSQHFRLLWESIHGVGAWAKNPFVWAISFERVARDPGAEVAG